MEKCIEFYNELVDLLKNTLNVDVTTFNLTLSLDERLNNFYKSLENEDTFALFSQTKIKAFSARTVETYDLSSSLFQDYTLKTAFNNQTEEVKSQLWEALFLLYIELERLNNKFPERVKLLKEQIRAVRHSVQKPELKSDILKNLIKTDVNKDTNNMLDDIMGSFTNMFNNKGGANPFENIMNLSNMISEKYSDKIQNGDIELDKLLNGMTGAMGGGDGMMDNLKNMMGGDGLMDGLKNMMGGKKDEAPVVIDEQFSTSNIDVGKEDESKGFNLGALNKFKPLVDMVSKLGNLDGEGDLEDIKNNLDTFMKDELKVDMDKYKDHMSHIEKELMSKLNPENSD